MRTTYTGNDHNNIHSPPFIYSTKKPHLLKHLYLLSTFFIEQFWMDDMVCQGDESSLTQCIFSGWGSSDCTPTEAAGVKCRKQETHVPLNLSSKKKAGVPLHEVLDIRYTSLRLVGGRNALEGRVEVRHYYISEILHFSNYLSDNMSDNVD